MAGVVRSVGDTTAVVSYEPRFTHPVVVDQVTDDLSISAKVSRLDADERTARIDITVTSEGQKVLGKTQAHLKFSS